MKILVVDDDALAAEMTAAVLESLGHPVSIAGDALAALEALAAEPDIGLVVSDMNMPLMSGVELFRELREQGHTQPFVLLSGDDPATIQVQEPALDACLAKDFDLVDRLPELIARLLAQAA